jgi:DNA-directed RNA polymerase omega subunit
MQDLPIDKLWEKTGSMYKLIVLASKRALELSDNGATKLVEISSIAKVPSIALQEILEGKISYKIKEGK